jgi:hypothetical protein
MAMTYDTTRIGQPTAALQTTLAELILKREGLNADLGRKPRDVGAICALIGTNDAIARTEREIRSRTEGLVIFCV